MQLNNYYMHTMGQFYQTGQISMRAQFQNSADGSGNFCEWFTNNVQIKENRCDMSFTYQPTQYTEHSANYCSRK